jgi:DMSO/TMAO reductase YedYZ heme-binding membrane subunit
LIRSIIRVTARVSIALFLLAFTASSLRALFPSPGSTWVLQNRRYLGVSFALSHFAHLIALFALGALFPHPFLDETTAVTFLGGGLAYVFITAMTITSFAPPRRLIGERAWKILHTTGSYYIWFIFFISYVPHALQNSAYIPLATALVLAFGLRMTRRYKRRAPRTAPLSISTESTESTEY